MEKEDHSRSKEPAKRDGNERLDRHSAQGVDPNPKKGGYGGWGTVNDELESKPFDQADPNYTPDEEHK